MKYKYIKRIIEIDRVTREIENIPLSSMFQYSSSTGYISGTFNGLKIINFKCINHKKIMICKMNQHSLLIRTSEKCFINNYTLFANKIYKLEIETFVRTSNWVEYVGMKSQFYDHGKGAKMLLEVLDKIYEVNS